MQQKNTYHYGQKSYSDNNVLVNKPAYQAINKKTEKLVTALYMVTDCMGSDDALKAKLRFLGVELLSDIYKLSTLSPIDKSVHIEVLVIRTNEVLSCVNIASTMGFISEMNSTILHKEFKKLVKDLEGYQSKDSQFPFTLSESLFETFEETEIPLTRSQSAIKDNNSYKGQNTKKSFTMPVYNQKISGPALQKGLLSDGFSNVNKEERTQKILALIKDKKGTTGGQGGISIKDISIAFTDCSEKTIQRELNSLVAKGQIQKVGAKRWSRYQTL